MTNNKLTTIYIARHGETEWNIKKLMQGHSDSPLTFKGKEQAVSLAKKLQYIKFNAVFSSDLLRAKKTAEVVALDKKLAVITTKVLREKYFGKYEGKPAGHFFGELEKLLQKRGKLEKEERLSLKLEDGMESDLEAVSRLITFLREVAIGYSGKTVLVVTHGGLMRCLLIKLGYFTYEEIPSSGGLIQNTAYIKIKSDGIDFFIKELSGISKTKT